MIDVLTYIASEFLYHIDCMNLIQSFNFVDIKPYQFNFENNKKMKRIKHLKQFKGTYNFDVFYLRNAEQRVYQNLKINTLKIHKDFMNGSIWDCSKGWYDHTKGYLYYLKKSKNVKIKHVQMQDAILRDSCIDMKVFVGSPQSLCIEKGYHDSFFLNFPKSIKTLIFGKHFRWIVEFIPDTIEHLVFINKHVKQLPKKLPDSLKSIQFAFDDFDHLIKNVSKSINISNSKNIKNKNYL